MQLATLCKILANNYIAASSSIEICDTGRVGKIINGKEVSFLSSKVPCYKEDDIKKAIELTIEAVYSSKFEHLLNNYIADSIGTGPHTDAWKGVTAHNVVSVMKAKLQNTYLETYGGPLALYKYRVYGNLAYDGILNGPIRINRIPLRERSVPSISATIAHEISHRAGLTHPSSRKKLSIAKK